MYWERCKRRSGGSGGPPPSGSSDNVERPAGSDEVQSDSAKNMPDAETNEELSEAEKAFNVRFKQWEEAVNNFRLRNSILRHTNEPLHKNMEAIFLRRRKGWLKRREQLRHERIKNNLGKAQIIYEFGILITLFGVSYIF